MWSDRRKGGHESIAICLECLPSCHQSEYLEWLLDHSDARQRWHCNLAGSHPHHCSSLGSFALVWLAFALISIATKPPSFSIGFWGFTFPLGVLATCSNLLAENLDSEYFKVSTAVRNWTCFYLPVTKMTIDDSPLCNIVVDCGSDSNRQACYHRRNVSRTLFEGSSWQVSSCRLRQKSLGDFNLSWI